METIKNKYKIIMGQSPKGTTYNREGKGLPLLNGPTEFGLHHPVSTLFTTDSKRECEVGDLIFCVRGSTTGRMNWADKKYSLGRGVCSFRGGNRLETKYLRYCLEFKLEELLNFAGGGTFPNLTKDVLHDFLIPYGESRLIIASILSVYDDLIENNTRRIQILEEMCQRIYREWFVDFRFPGHEKVKLINSEMGKIPEGWEAITVGDVLESIESGSRPKGGIDPNEKGVPSIGAENILGLGQYEFEKEKYVSREFFENMRRGIVQDKDVLLYKDGAKIGRKSIFRDGFPHEECCINEHAFILRTNSRCSQNYLFFYLDRNDVTQKIIGLNTNAAQPGINQPGVKGLSLLLPEKRLIDLFETHAEPLLSLLFNLAKKNKILRAKRDVLLPRLISGEIDVSELDIELKEEANVA